MSNIRQKQFNKIKFQTRLSYTTVTSINIHSIGVKC